MYPTCIIDTSHAGDNEHGVSFPLRGLGYDSYFAEQMGALGDFLRPGRVVGQHRREWDLATEDGTQRAVLAGKRWDPERGTEAADAQPTVGDWVAWRSEGEQGPPVIEHVLKRRTSLSRSSVAKRGARQTLVANIDWVAVVAALTTNMADDAVAKRSLSPRRIERYLAAIQSGGAKPIVLLNKADLASDADAQASALRERLSGCPVVPVSCFGESGLTGLGEYLKDGETWGLVGLSGVGKSSIVNRLLGRDAQKVGAERANDARGRHTTTHRELFQTESGVLLIDTPGMREFALAGSTEADLEAFKDITELSKRCQFRDCHHKKEPGCAVRKAVTAGRLELDRLVSFQTLSAELRASEKTASVRRSPRRRAKDRERMRRGHDEDD